jgi:hypothetical protein
MKKTRLNFMVVPEQLAAKAFVKQPVKIKIHTPNAPCLEGVLGESGRKLAADGFEFYFERKMAKKLVKHGVASIVPLPQKTKIYFVRGSVDMKCPVCKSPLGYSPMGSYCSNDKCEGNYVDGTARFTQAQAKKFKDIILW